MVIMTRSIRFVDNETYRILAAVTSVMSAAVLDIPVGAALTALCAVAQQM